MTVPRSQTESAAAVCAPAIFARILVGVDASASAREAVRQAARLLAGGGSLELLAAYQVVYPAAVSGTTIAAYTEEYAKLYEEQAASALARARAEAGGAEVVGKVVNARPADALLAEAERERATLIAVGSHGHGRAAGVLLGSVATEVVHRSPCSVLIARKELRPFLRTIVVGLDGSPQSALAYAVAAELAERFGAQLWPVVAHGGKPLDRVAIERLTEQREESLDEPVPALLAAAADADLLVVGSRGLHGLRALGSVSERVAHAADCSTVIVRQPPSPDETA